LRGRLVLVLTGGLLLAQGLSAYINFSERDQLMANAGGLQQAQRIRDAVQLLDTLAPAERQRIAAVLNVPPLVLSLPAQPSPSGPASAGLSGTRAAMFSSVLLAALGEPRGLRVDPIEGQLADAPGRPHHGDRPHRVPALRIQVLLRDGSWAQFHTQLPPPSAAPPWRLALTLAVLLAAVLLLTLLAVRWLTRPLALMAQAADALGQDIRHPPLAETGPLEVRRAAKAFNAMQQRLCHLIDDRTRVLAAMSHDLKTPITRMRLRAELLDDDELRQRFEADLQEMQAMVTDTLEFMRGLGGHAALQPVDLMALLESLQADNQAMGRAMSIEGACTAPVMAVPGLLKRCLGNLIDNAVLHGERATVVVDDSALQTVLLVRDAGPGIPEAELGRVFEPFHRLEASRNRATGGTGLGLSIARNIAQTHGGDIRLRNLPQGGLEAALVLPRSPTHQAGSSPITMRPSLA
jgi:signal transduction histidine kinase